MAAAVGIVGSIISVLQLSEKVVKYLAAMKDASVDRQRLLLEIQSVTGLLYMLKERLAGASSETLPWTHSLDAPEGPVTQFRQALEELVPKLLPAEGWKKVEKTLSWPFKKEEIVAILGRIERQKSLFGLALQNDHIALSEALRADITSLSEGVQEIRMTQKGRSKLELPLIDPEALMVVDNTNNQVLQWLSFTNPSTNHEAARKKHEPSTGAWLLRSQSFMEWKNSATSFLWLHGIPGCGKTILCSTVIEDIASVYKNGFAYYYFDFNDRAKQDVENFLRSIIAQLSRGADTFPDCVEKLYDDFNRTWMEPSAETLLETLFTIIQIQGHGPCFLIVDALDESERKGVLAILLRIGSRGLSNLHILVTSRKERDIEVVLAPIVTSTYSLSLDTTDVDADISLYVRQCLATDPKLRRWSDPVKAEIETSLAEGAHGMFRWVECQITALQSCRTESLLRKTLKQLPKTLDETYDRILLNIPEEDKQMARSALLWLAFSERPLYLDEVAEAAILSPECCTLDPGDRLLDPHEIIDICSGLITSLPVTTTQRVGRELIEVKRERELLRFAHFSVKEYIISDRIGEGNASAFAMLESKAQTFLAQVCISYLLLFHNHELASVEQVRANPMLGYAARFWHKHASSSATLPASTVSQMCSLFRPDQGASFLNWLRIYDPNSYYVDPDGIYLNCSQMDKELSDVASPLYYASFLGLLEVVSYLVHGESDIDTKCGDWGNALRAAASRGHALVVSLLLLHGADSEAGRRRLESIALAAAVTGGHESVVQVFMTKELDTEANGQRIIEALFLAAVHGHEPIVRLIGNSEACCNLSGEDLYHPLLSAVREGHTSMVQTLLSLGANIKPVEDLRKSGVLLQSAAHEYNRSYSTIKFDNALDAAASTGQVSMMRLLLAQGYDLRTTCNGALQIAAVYGQLALTEFLLSQGVDVNVQGGRYGSALRAAVLGRDSSVVQTLLEAGAKVNAQGDEFGTALQEAAWKGKESVVQILLQAGADINAHGGGFGTALQLAAIGGHASVAQTLLKVGADVHAQGVEPGTALQSAASAGWASIVQMLLKAGADVNVEGGSYGSALQLAAGRGRLPVVQTLLQAGADVNAQGGGCGTALQAAVIWLWKSALLIDEADAYMLALQIALLLLRARAEVPPKLATEVLVQEALAILKQEEGGDRLYRSLRYRHTNSRRIHDLRKVALDRKSSLASSPQTHSRLGT